MHGIFTSSLFDHHHYFILYFRPYYYQALLRTTTVVQEVEIRRYQTGLITYYSIQRKIVKTTFHFQANTDIILHFQ